MSDIVMIELARRVTFTKLSRTRRLLGPNSDFHRSATIVELWNIVKPLREELDLSAMSKAERDGFELAYRLIDPVLRPTPNVVQPKPELDTSDLI